MKTIAKLVVTAAFVLTVFGSSLFGSTGNYPYPTQAMFPARNIDDSARLYVAQSYAIVLGQEYLKVFYAQIGMWTAGVDYHPIYPDLDPPAFVQPVVAKAVLPSAPPPVSKFRRPSRNTQ